MRGVFLKRKNARSAWARRRSTAIIKRLTTRPEMIGPQQWRRHTKGGRKQEITHISINWSCYTLIYIHLTVLGKRLITNKNLVTLIHNRKLGDTLNYKSINCNRKGKLPKEIRLIMVFSLYKMSITTSICTSHAILLRHPPVQITEMNALKWTGSWAAHKGLAVRNVWAYSNMAARTIGRIRVIRILNRIPRWAPQIRVVCKMIQLQG